MEMFGSVLSIVFYIALCWASANHARNREMGFFAGIIICFLFTPVVGLVAILASPKNFVTDKQWRTAFEQGRLHLTFDEYSLAIKKFDEAMFWRKAFKGSDTGPDAVQGMIRERIKSVQELMLKNFDVAMGVSTPL